MKQARFPAGWNEARVREVLEHYEGQTEDEALAEDEAAFQSRGQTVMVVPNRLVPEITRLIERRHPARATRSYRSDKASQPAAHTPRRGLVPIRLRRCRLTRLEPYPNPDEPEPNRASIEKLEPISDSIQVLVNIGPQHGAQKYPARRQQDPTMKVLQ
jgi:hypothetical protein